ncbi:MAG: SRPBCC family protein [Betaproteobacteria bacterium]|jgi:hypothetical protein|nr:SRPBCC family protein [Burkholderiales bacterium]MCE2646556.1 SRPBCC family protein [Burkholderiaceae bacterium]
MMFEDRIVVSAPAARVFAVYANVGRWSSWDPDVKAASIDGAFVSGASGTLDPTRGPRAKITFVEVVPNRSFTVKSSLPLCSLYFEHELSEGSGTTTVVHRVVFDGPLSPLFGRLVGSQIRKGLPGTLQGLKRAAEGQS